MARPVIGTAVGGIPEVVLDGDTGLLVPPRDSKALARAMRRLYSEPELRAALAQRGRNLVEAKFSLERMAAEIETVYDVLREQARAGWKQVRQLKP